MMIKWEYDGFSDSSRRKWITYEEVINDSRPIHYKTVLGTRVASRAPEGRANITIRMMGYIDIEKFRKLLRKLLLKEFEEAYPIRLK